MESIALRVLGFQADTCVDWITIWSRITVSGLLEGNRIDWIALALASLMSLALVACLAQMHRKHRIYLKCFFCHREVAVLFHLRDCWDCPYCLKENADYIRLIPSLEWINFQVPLCTRCINGQRYKLQELNALGHVPEDEMEFNQERLDQKYQLCHRCWMAVFLYTKRHLKQHVLCRASGSEYPISAYISLAHLKYKPVNGRDNQYDY